MFTIRQVQSDGSEQLFTAKVARLEWMANDGETPRRCLNIAYEDRTVPSGLQEIMLCSGVVYVMNEYGKTVAKYDFMLPPLAAQPTERPHQRICDLLRSVRLGEADARELIDAINQRTRLAPSGANTPV